MKTNKNSTLHSVRYSEKRIALPKMEQENNPMNMKRLTVGSLVGFIALYILGVVIWEIVFAEFFATNAGSATGIDRESPVVWAIALGTLFHAALLTLAIESRSGTAPLADGAKVGAVVGFLLWGTADFVLYGYLNVNNLTATIADVVLEAVRGGIGGAIIAAVLSKIGD